VGAVSSKTTYGNKGKLALDRRPSAAVQRSFVSRPSEQQRRNTGWQQDGSDRHRMASMPLPVDIPDWRSTSSIVPDSATPTPASVTDDVSATPAASSAEQRRRHRRQDPLEARGVSRRVTGRDTSRNGRYRRSTNS